MAPVTRAQARKNIEKDSAADQVPSPNQRSENEGSTGARSRSKEQDPVPLGANHQRQEASTETNVKQPGPDDHENDRPSNDADDNVSVSNPKPETVVSKESGAAADEGEDIEKQSDSSDSWEDITQDDLEKPPNSRRSSPSDYQSRRSESGPPIRDLRAADLSPRVKHLIFIVLKKRKELEDRGATLEVAVVQRNRLRNALALSMRSTNPALRSFRADVTAAMRSDSSFFSLFGEQLREWTPVTPFQRQAKVLFARLDQDVASEKHSLAKCDKSLRELHDQILENILAVFPGFAGEDGNHEPDNRKMHRFLDPYLPDWAGLEEFATVATEARELLEENDQEINEGNQERWRNPDPPHWAVTRRFIDARKELHTAEDRLARHFFAFNYPEHVQRYERRVDAGEILPPLDAHYLNVGAELAKAVTAAEKEYSDAASQARSVGAMSLSQLTSRFSSRSGSRASSPFGMGGIGMPRDYHRVREWMEHVSGSVGSSGIMWSEPASSLDEGSSMDLSEFYSGHQDPVDGRAYGREARHIQKWNGWRRESFENMQGSWGDKGWLAAKPPPTQRDALIVGQKRKREVEPTERVAASPSKRARRDWPCGCDLM